MSEPSVLLCSVPGSVFVVLACCNVAGDVWEALVLKCERGKLLS